MQSHISNLSSKFVPNLVFTKPRSSNSLSHSPSFPSLFLLSSPPTNQSPKKPFMPSPLPSPPLPFHPSRAGPLAVHVPQSTFATETHIKIDVHDLTISPKPKKKKKKKKRRKAHSTPPNPLHSTISLPQFCTFCRPWIMPGGEPILPLGSYPLGSYPAGLGLA